MKLQIQSSKVRKTKVLLSFFVALVISVFFFSFAPAGLFQNNVEKDIVHWHYTGYGPDDFVKLNPYINYLTGYYDVLTSGGSGGLMPLFLFVKTQEIKRAEQARLDSLRKKALIYGRPEEAGVDHHKLMMIDSIVLDAIEKGAMPGAQVFVARRGRIIYEKAFGHHDYNGKTPVQMDDLYDIASITKIAATTLAAIKMMQEGSLDLDAPLGNYFRDTIIRYTHFKTDTLIRMDSICLAELSADQIDLLKESEDIFIFGDSLMVQRNMIIDTVVPEKNIFSVPVRYLLVHQSGLNPSLPILPYYLYAESYAKIIIEEMEYEELLAQRMEHYEEVPQAGNGIILEETSEVDPNIIEASPVHFDLEEAFGYFYSKTLEKGEAETKVADSMYLRNAFRDSLFADARRIRVHEDVKYQYACINMILLQMAIDSINGVDLDAYLKHEFFRSLGMANTTFNPLSFFPKERIIPTENDHKWRRQQVHGTVHDPSAALMGGIAGNAGLFSTASDLGIFGQMLLNGGAYNGVEYLEKEILDQFTKKQAENHRGLGFDKPSENGIHAKDIHPDSYGHLGFTGGALWIDPVNEIVFVFLSNRVTPNASNNTFAKLRVRQNVHQAVYDAILD